MPTYEFRCPDGTIIERSFKISEVPEQIPAPDGSGMAVRQISGGGALLFKGSGFYITDYGKDGKKDQRTAGANTKPGADGASGGESAKPAEAGAKPAEGAKTESKPASPAASSSGASSSGSSSGAPKSGGDSSSGGSKSGGSKGDGPKSGGSSGASGAA